MNSIRTVQDLIEALSKFPLTLEIRNKDYKEIIGVNVITYPDLYSPNLPYNEPGKKYVCID